MLEPQPEARCGLIPQLEMTMPIMLLLLTSLEAHRIQRLCI